MLIACAHSAAESAAPGAVSVTSRVEVAATGSAARTRLVYEGSWGLARLVAAVEPGGDRPLLVASGLDLGGALVGPVRLAGAWRELARPLGHDAGTTVYREPTGLRPDTAISPGRLRGVQLTPLPGVAVAGYLEPAPASARRARRSTVLAAAAGGAPLPALGLEAYAAVRTGAAPAVSTRWLLPAPPFPGGELAHAGIRARIAAGAGELAGSVNASLGPRLPPAFHVRLSGRAPSPYGELAASVAAAGREFRALGGGAPAASLAWAARLSGAAGPRPWRVGYRFAARGVVPRPALHAAGAGAAAPHTVELAVTPSVRLGAVTLGGEGAVRAGPHRAVPTLAVEARARPGTVSLRWRGARSGDTLQVRAAASASPVAVEAGWRIASDKVTTQLAVEVRLPRGRLRVAAAGLGDRFPNGPRLTVTMSAQR